METKILELLSKELPDVDFAGSDELVSDGVIDSFTLTNIIATLSMEFGIEIPYEELTEDNFNSVQAIAEMVSRLM